MNVKITETNCIEVMPMCPFSGPMYHSRIRIEKLCFWSNGTSEHPVTDRTVELFLKNVVIYGASIYHQKPEAGCYALNGDLLYSDGEMKVWQIYYKGNLIYSRS